MVLDYLIDGALASESPLVLCNVDLEKALDAVPQDRLIRVLADHYYLYPHIVKTVHRMYTNVHGWVVGHNEYFGMIMGVKQGCPLSPTLFGIHFDSAA